MPRGFIGHAAYTYLTKITETMGSANIQHTSAPSGANDRGMIHTTPYPPDTAKTGGYSTGKGDQSNIVVKTDVYDDTLFKMVTFDNQIGEATYNVATQIAEMCSTIFIVPQTSAKIIEFVEKLKSLLVGEYQEFMIDARIRVHEFIDEISNIDGGSESLIVINAQETDGVREEVERVLNDKVRAMQSTISSHEAQAAQLEAEAAALEAQAAAQDVIARTAMMTISGPNGTSRSVPDEARRSAARAQAVSLRAQAAEKKELARQLRTHAGLLRGEIARVQQVISQTNTFIRTLVEGVQQADLRYAGVLREISERTRDFTARVMALMDGISDSLGLSSGDVAGVNANFNAQTGVGELTREEEISRILEMLREKNEEKRDDWTVGNLSEAQLRQLAEDYVDVMRAIRDGGDENGFIDILAHGKDVSDAFSRLVGAPIVTVGTVTEYDLAFALNSFETFLVRNNFGASTWPMLNGEMISELAAERATPNSTTKDLLFSGALLGAMFAPQAAGRVISAGRAAQRVNDRALRDAETAQANSVNRPIRQPYASMTREQLQRAQRAHERLIDEHQRKLQDYIRNPNAYDNRGLLNNVPPHIREEIINGRIRALETQIRGQQSNLDEIIRALNLLK